MEEKKKSHNVPCSLLSKEENFKLFDLLGARCFTLASAVTQVLLTEPPSHSHWLKRFCGVVCFIKDCVRRSYFLKVFDIDKANCVWEQEIYHQFVYKDVRSFFHTFEGNDCMVGFNFADDTEAFDFKQAVHKMLQNRQEKRQERRRNQGAQPTNAGILVPLRSKSESVPSLVPKDEKMGRKTKKKKLTKEDIGNPTNFVHTQHVGWNPVTGFEVHNADPAMQTFFSAAGVSEKDLNDNETCKFIYDFIEDHGGLEVVKKAAMLSAQPSSQPPPPPAREAPATPRNARGSPSMRTAPRPPPPPPSLPDSRGGLSIGVDRSHSVSRLQKTSGMVPPAPPSRGPPPARPPMPNIAVPQSVPPQSGSIPPPPPPPPPPPAAMTNSGPPPPPPPPPSMQMGGRGGGSGAVVDVMHTDARSAMLEQIRQGRTLHHVETNGSAQENNSHTDDARGSLLNEIRRGIELKPVSDDRTPVSATAAPMHGLAAALAKALQERNHAIHHTDESDSGLDDDDNDDDEWED